MENAGTFDSDEIFLLEYRFSLVSRGFQVGEKGGAMLRTWACASVSGWAQCACGTGYSEAGTPACPGRSRAISGGRLKDKK